MVKCMNGVGIAVSPVLDMAFTTVCFLVLVCAQLILTGAYRFFSFKVVFLFLAGSAATYYFFVFRC